MKKKMVCYALFSVLGLCAFTLPAHATNDEYAPTAEEMNPDMLENDGLPLNYELEIDETDQPFINDDPFLGAEGSEGGVLEEMGEDPQEMMDTSLQEDKTTF